MIKNGAKNKTCFEVFFDKEGTVELKENLLDAFRDDSANFTHILSDASFKIEEFPDNASLENKVRMFIAKCKKNNSDQLLKWFRAILKECSGLTFFSDVVKCLEEYKQNKEEENVADGVLLNPPPKITFNLQNRDFYSDLLKRFDENTTDNGAGVICERDGLCAKLKKNISEYPIVIIEGSQCSGKSTLVKLFSKHVDSEVAFINSIPETAFDGFRKNLKNKKPMDVIDLYVSWGQTILTAIFHQKNMKILEQKGHIRKLLSHDSIFRKDLLEQRERWDLTTDLEAMLRVIDDALNNSNYEPPVVISVHLDDFHTYSDDKIIIGFRDSLRTLSFEKSHDPIFKKIKLLISTRFLPLQKKYFTLPVQNFNDKEIMYFVDLLSEFGDETSKNIFINKIKEFTDGYPWFVIRFLRLYLKKRTEGDIGSPIYIAEDIFNTGQYWMFEDEFGAERDQTHFIRGLEQLLFEFDDANEDFFSFLNESDAIDEEKYKINPILMQSGFLKVSTGSNRRVLGFGNKLIRQHYTENTIREVIDVY